MTHTVNVKYKDRVFRAYFGAEENRDKLLSLYNALNDSNYEDPAELEINTLDDVIYMKMKYEKYRVQNHINMFTSALQKIPTPQYYVFYNGKADAPDKTMLKLSDAFMQPVKEGKFEWTAVMLNVNHGRNKELMDKCKPLAEYAMLVAKAREYLADGMEFSEAIDEAVNWCINNDCMVEYLRKHREEVTDMWLTEYNEDEIKEAMRLDGIAEGRAVGLVTAVESIMANLSLPLAEACKALNTTIEEYNRMKESLSKQG